MIQLSKNSSSDAPKPLRSRLIGIGNAGSHLADRFLVDFGSQVDVLTVNTDAHALSSSIAPQKIPMGTHAARGLGAGGDPKIGASAAEESMTELRAATEGMDLVVLCAGLGGGTGSGALPLIANCANLSGAWVVAFVTMPFSFEGGRRIRQARRALEELSEFADVIVTFENDRMSEIARPQSGVGETFAAADQVLCKAMQMLFQMLTLPGSFRLTLADLRGLFAGKDGRCLFGVGSCSGPTRIHDAAEAALKTPMLLRGRALAGADHVLVYIAAPESVTLAEVTALMTEVQKHTEEDALISMGIGFTEDAETVTVSLLGRVPVEVQKSENVERPKIRQISMKGKAPSSKGKKKAEFTQETLPFLPSSRGRFEKSLPTIIEGEDLDVPTFLRQKIKIQ